MFHYYLSREVSKLFVYYAWLVRLFYNQPGLLAFNTAMPQSSFLWARRDTENKNWDSVQLSHILASQFEESLGTSINIIIWRHVAVAASRRHLKSGQFKRDYDVVGNYADHQTAQPSLIAGNVYARLLEEAPHPGASARQQYRIMSREWRTFLGFNAY
jgi:hypothetical protein